MSMMQRKLIIYRISQQTVEKQLSIYKVFYKLTLNHTLTT